MRQRASNRTKRVPFGVRKLKLELDKDTQSRLKKENKVGRWINDVDTRIQDARSGGYEFVNDNGSEYIEVGGEKQEADRRIKKSVGQGITAYLMAIPRKFYDEDQERKEQLNYMVDESIRGGKPAGTPDHGISPNLGGTYRKNVEYKP